jgi:thioredoxin 1
MNRKSKRKEFMNTVAVWPMIAGICLLLVSFSARAETPLINARKNQSISDNRVIVSPRVTFIELGSIKCIPCRKMQPVMEAVQARYGSQLKMIFYDVWKTENHAYAKQYDIRIIPTQVFLDSNGKEFFRHSGFFPEAAINQILEKQGLKPRITN